MVVGVRGWVHTGASLSSSSSSSLHRPCCCHCLVCMVVACGVGACCQRDEEDEEEKEKSANALRSFKLRSNITWLVTLAKKHLKSQLYLGVHFTYNRIQEKFKLHNYCTQYATASGVRLYTGDDDIRLLVSFYTPNPHAFSTCREGTKHVKGKNMLPIWTEILMVVFVIAVQHVYLTIFLLLLISVSRCQVLQEIFIGVCAVKSFKQHANILWGSIFYVMFFQIFKLRTSDVP